MTADPPAAAVPRHVPAPSVPPVEEQLSASVAEFLGKLDLFAPLDPAALKELAKQAEVIAVRAGVAVCRQGEAPDALYVIIDGDFDVFVETPEAGGELRVNTLMPGGFFGEMGIFTGQPRTATVRAASGGGLVARLASEPVLELAQRESCVSFGVIKRLSALTGTFDQMQALGAVSRLISSTLDLDRVLTSILQYALRLSGAQSGAIFEFVADRPAPAAAAAAGGNAPDPTAGPEPTGGVFLLRAAERLDERIVRQLQQSPPRLGDASLVPRAAAERKPIQVPDVQAIGHDEVSVRDQMVDASLHAVMAVPLVREHQVVGALTLARVEPGEFDPQVVEFLRMFASQTGLALQNARLFGEVEAQRERDLEYLRAVAVVTDAAAALEAGQFNPPVLDPVAARLDALGRLARVFRRMAREVKAREEQLHQQVRELRIEIDEAKKVKALAEVTGTDYFRDLQRRAGALRQRARPTSLPATPRTAPPASPNDAAERSSSLR